jgi:hypothetical protein
MRLHSETTPSRGLGFCLKIIGTLAIASLAGCGAPSGGNSANSAGSVASTFDASFNASFDKSTHDSCVTSAQTHGAAADVAEKYCTCVVAQLDKLSTADKMALPQHEETLTAAANACKPS